MRHKNVIERKYTVYYSVGVYISCLYFNIINFIEYKKKKNSNKIIKNIKQRNKQKN